MIYVMSDMHGCFDKYQQMLCEISFSSRDTLYVLGDVIDRGADGVKILLDMSLRPNVFPLLGNHEFTAAICMSWIAAEITDEQIDALSTDKMGAYSEWIVNGGEPTIESLKRVGRETLGDIQEYFQEMELYTEVEVGGRSFLLVHAGLDNFAPGKPLDEYGLSDFLFARPQLEQDYFPDKFVIFGHTPVQFLRRRLGEAPSASILRRGNQIVIDCGCSFPGGRLGCLCLDTMEEFYV